MKALFADPVINKTQNLGAVNSINWARILAQITYYFQAYFLLLRSPSFQVGSKIRFVVPTGNFGDVLAGYYAKRMGLPIEKLLVATNENDILDRFWKSGYYEKKPVHGREADGGLAEDGAKAHEDGAKETLSPAMDILVSSNFERLLWFLAYEYDGSAGERSWQVAGSKVKSWLEDLKRDGGFGVEPEVLELAKRDFESERVSDSQTVDTIKQFYRGSSEAETGVGQGQTSGDTKASYILDPHSAVGIAAALRSIAKHPPPVHHITLATAHPAKFAHAVDLALKDENGFDFDNVLPEQFIGLEKMEKRVRVMEKGAKWEDIRTVISEELAKEEGLT